MVFLHDYTRFLRIVLHGCFNIKYFILTYGIIILILNLAITLE